MSPRKLTALVAVLLISNGVIADSVLEVQTTERRGAAPVMGTVEVSTSGSKSKLDIASVDTEESGTMIFDGDIGELVVVDHEEKRYYVIDKQQMDAMAKQVRDARRQMEEALANVPPEQQAMARQMMRLPEAVPEPPPTTLSKTGESDNVAGHDCDYFDVMQEGRRIRDLCITPWKNIEEGRETADALIKLGDFFDSMRKAFSQGGGSSLVDRQQDMYGYMNELEGYPVLSRDYGADGVVEYESRLVSSRQEELDDAIFARPEDYKQHSLPGRP